ncbi:MAG TPA: Tad domain-containing protein [Ktedonobacterales bacterium]
MQWQIDEHLGLGHRRRRLAARGRRRRTGQTLIIFALSLTVLLGLAGLAVDATRAYDLYARMQRAAEADALAGDLYMPTNYNTPRTVSDPNSAISRASQEVVKNGFGTVLSNNLPAAYFGCPNTPSTFEVMVCPVTGFPSNLRVTITEQLNVVLLGALGVQPITLHASGQAAYLSPILIAARANYFGDQTECSTSNSQNTNTSYCDPGSSGNHLNNFFATMDGPAELKQAGDPMVYCEEGPSGVASASDLDRASTFPAYNNFPTNHAQWQPTGPITTRCGNPVLGGNPGNPDHQPTGYDGPATQGTAHAGGYNYELSVAPGLTPSLFIYNPTYVPQDVPATGSPPLDHFLDQGTTPGYYQGPRAEGIGTRFDGVHHDAPLFYYDTTVTLYTVNSQYQPGYNLVACYPATGLTFHPYDATTADLTAHGCSTATILGGGTMANRPAQVYDPLWNGANTANTYHTPGVGMTGTGACRTVASDPTDPFATGFTGAGCMLQWCKISPPGGLNPGTGGGLFRLVIEATGLTAATSDYTSSSLDGWGQHAYSLKLCADPAATTPYSCGNGSNATGAGQYNTAPLALFGWNNADVVYQDLLSTRTPNKNYPQSACVNTNTTPYACLDLGCISSVYAGRDVTARIYNLGSSSGTGDVYVAVVPPAGSTATVAPMPAYIPTFPGGIDGNSPAAQARDSTNTYRLYTGRWLNFQLHMPSDYKVNCTTTGNGTGWWQVMFASVAGVQPNDKVGIQLILTGSPLHLVPPLFV